MNKRVSCSKCGGHGFNTVTLPIWTSGGLTMLSRRVVCPKCKGARYYLAPVTNHDVISKVPVNKSMEVLSKVASEAVVESLVVCHGATLNEAQKDHIRNSIQNRFMEFLDSSPRFDDSEWGDFSKLDLSGFIPTMEDFMRVNNE